MGLKGFGGSRTVIRAMALAAALSMGFAVTAPPPAKAEAEDSAFKKWKRNKAGGGNTTAARRSPLTLQAQARKPRRCPAS